MKNDHIEFGQGVTYDRGADAFLYDGSEGPIEKLSLNRAYKIVFELLYACNFSCEFCMKSSDEGMPPTEDIRKYLDTLVVDGPLRTTLSGGEPSLRKDLESLLEYGASIGHIFHLVTNGSRLQPGKQLVDAVSMFEVGLDGGTPEAYRKMRGLDVFSHTAHTIRKLISLGARVRVTHVLSAVNAEQAHLMPQVCANLGVQEFRFQRFIPYGRGALHEKKFHIDDEQVTKVVDKTRGEAEKLGVNFLPPPARKFYYGAIYVRPDGDIVYRDGDGEHDFERSIGNLKAAAMRDVWTPQIGSNHRKIVVNQPRF